MNIMKKNRFKRVLSVALAAVMVAGTISFMPGGTTEVQASTNPSTINLRTGGIGNPDTTASDTWSGSKVYYGGKECYVLDKDGSLTNGKSSVSNHMLLLTKDFLSATQAFDDDKSDWSTSTIRGNLNDTEKTEASGGFLGTMTSVEQTSIDATTINSSKTTNGGYASYPSGTTSDKIFLLDLADVNNANYGFTSNNTRAASSWWWLRSPGDDDLDAADVSAYGDVFSGGLVLDEGGSVRPAFNLNLSSVLFTSASGTSKSSFASVNTTSANTWKLTLKDSSKGVSITSGQSVSRNGQTITVPYTYTGSDVSQISIMITDKAYGEGDASILYYGALTTTLAATGTGTFTLPEGLSEDYKVYMMAEDVNGDTLSDYSSEPVALTIPEPVSTYDVTVTPGSNMTKTNTSGTESQTGLTGAMTDVVYKANEGFYFPTNYSVAAVSGVSVTRNSYTQITVSGTPTATATITLTDATAKGTQNAPAGLSDGVDKIAGTTTAMEYILKSTYDGNNNATWSSCTLSNTTVAAGTYYVRLAGTDTLLAGEKATVTVTASPNPPTLYQVTVTNGTGDGSYAKDASVTITADAAPSGQHFKEWTGTDSLTFTSGSKDSATAVFTMPANAVTVTATYENDTTTPDPTPATPTYKIIEGAGGTWTSGTDGTLSIRGDGEVSKFKEVKVDGTVVDGSNYTVTEGYTIVTLKADYLKTLSAGNHTFELVWTDGSASTSFTVKEAAATTPSNTPDTPSNKDDVPKTGDSTPIVWLFVLALISGIGILYFGRKRNTVR
jgi:hypothetical protein